MDTATMNTIAIDMVTMNAVTTHVVTMENTKED